jgi:hypothetical protein
MSRFKDFLDFLVSAIFIIVAFYIYFEVSSTYGIYLVAAMIAILVLTYTIKLPKLITSKKHRKLFSFLKKHPIIREDQVVERFDMEPDKIHKQFFDLAKIWEKGPMILFIKRYYLFINKNIIKEIIALIEAMTSQKNKDLSVIIKKIGEQYPFETRVEIQSVISKLREKSLIK